jgi:hypothetical protein
MAADPQLPAELTAAGARVVIADMRALNSTVVALRVGYRFGFFGGGLVGFFFSASALSGSKPT